MKTSPNFAHIIVRTGMSLVFLWFGVSQLMNPSAWTGFLPDFTKSLPVSSEQLILANGFFEIIFGTLLLIGLFTRISALLLGLHLGAIASTLGFTSLGVRDFGLTLATLSIFFSGADSCTLDWRFARKSMVRDNRESGGI